MLLNSEITEKMVRIFDNIVPPFIRDSRFFMYPILKMFSWNGARYFMDFKKMFFELDDIAKFYEETSKYHLKRPTDINKKCISAIQENVVGENILDIACGRGYLSQILSSKYKVTGVDFVPPDLREGCSFEFVKGNICSLPFLDKSFNTVISAHTLEHVENIFLAISELRRVTKHRLIIVLPRQRPYKYTYNLHIHFFPYEINVLSILGARGRRYSLECVNGDWLYVEDI